MNACEDILLTFFIRVHTDVFDERVVLKFQDKSRSTYKNKCCNVFAKYLFSKGLTFES